MSLFEGIFSKLFENKYINPSNIFFDFKKKETTNELVKKIVESRGEASALLYSEKLMKNIEKRGRNMERNVTWEYIDALNQVYTEYFFRYQDTPLVIINTNNIDFVENESDLKEVIDYIRQPVSGTKFFNPVSEF